MMAMAPQQYIGTGRLGTTQSVAYTGTSAAITNSVSAQTYKVRVLCSSDAFVRIGDGTPTATTADAYVPALAAEYFTCTPGQKVAAVQVTAAGTLYVSELV
jgi:hypothetical protein